MGRCKKVSIKIKKYEKITQNKGILTRSFNRQKLSSESVIQHRMA